MSDQSETPNSPEPVPTPTPTTLITDPPSREGDPGTEGTEPNVQPPEPKQPGQEPDDSPIAEPEPLQPTDITFPEGVEVNEELRDQFLSVVNDKDLSPKDRAQALVDLQVKAAQAASEANSQAWAEMQTQWQDEVKADKEIGGDNLQPTIGRIGKLLDEYGSEELKGVFNLTGAGNNIHLIRFLNKVAGQLVEPSAPVSGSPTSASQTAAQRIYTTMEK